MQQFNVDIFDRTMTFVCNAVTSVHSIDDDYISPKSNAIDIINPSEQIIVGYFIRLQNDTFEFFGLITDVSPGEYVTKIQFASFITIFSETVLMWTKLQGTETNHNYSIEYVLNLFISTTYITNSDTLMRLPISIEIDPDITRTMKWFVGIRSVEEGYNYATPNIYENLIVPALKKYGVSITVTPDFNQKIINLLITKSSRTLNIDGNLDDVTVRTLKYNDKPLGINKLTVVNLHNSNMSVTFYVHPDGSFDLDNTNRITPVSFATRLVTPSDDTSEAFAVSALDTAYDTISGSEWNNLIELEVDPDNENIRPKEMEVGQLVTLWYEDATYKSILTGKIIEEGKIILLFGSERIDYTKRTKKTWRY